MYIRPILVNESGGGEVCQRQAHLQNEVGGVERLPELNHIGEVADIDDVRLIGDVG